MLERGPECDFYNDVASWFPLRVIMLILGLPASDEERLLRITQAYFGGSDPEVQRGTDLIHAAQAYIAYFDGVSEDRRRNPTDDVASLIANSQVDGKPIGHYEPPPTTSRWPARATTPRVPRPRAACWRCCRTLRSGAS
jgi:cytochrome P450